MNTVPDQLEWTWLRSTRSAWKRFQVVMSEYGPDLSRFPTEEQFTSHVTLVPKQPSRQIARRIGGDVAVFATARKFATLIYRLLR
jgi:hypothetical protein